MPATEADVLVGRRYLARGFLDAAMKLFLRNAEKVAAEDWEKLAVALLERGRLADAVRVSEMGGVALPRERLLALADGHLKRRAIEEAIRLYELAGADRQRWEGVVDVLVSLPERGRQAREIAERYLGAPAASEEGGPVPRRMKVVR